MSGIRYRRLAEAEIDRVGEIDRTERITSAYTQNGDRLAERDVDWNVRPWTADGHGEHSIAHQRDACARHLRAGAAALGAFEGERLVGLGLLTPHVRPGVAQLAFLHVSDGHRAQGVGARLADELEPDRARGRRRGDRRLGDAVRKHRALLPRARLRAGRGPAARALRARARGRSSTQTSVAPRAQEGHVTS